MEGNQTTFFFRPNLKKKKNLGTSWNQEPIYIDTLSQWIHGWMLFFQKEIHKHATTKNVGRCWQVEATDWQLKWTLHHHLSLQSSSSSWAWFFFLYFSLENSILSCVTVGLHHICSASKKKKKKKTVIFIYDIHLTIIIFTSKFQIKHWNMLYNVHTCIAIFFHLSYNPVSTHIINQNSYYKLCFTKIHKL